VVASVNLERRQKNHTKAEEIYEEALKVVDDKFTPFLICHYARYLSEISEKYDKCRRVYLDAVGKYKDSKILFSNYLKFETTQPGNC